MVERFDAAVGVTRRWAGASATLVVLRDAAAIEDAIGRSHRLLDAKGKVVVEMPPPQRTNEDSE